MIVSVCCGFVYVVCSCMWCVCVLCVCIVYMLCVGCVCVMCVSVCVCRGLCVWECAHEYRCLST